MKFPLEGRNLRESKGQYRPTGPGRKGVKDISFFSLFFALAYEAFFLSFNGGTEKTEGKDVS